MRKTKSLTVKNLIKKQLLLWADFYHKVFGIDLDAKIKIPKHKPGFNSLVIVAKGMTVVKICRFGKKAVPCWQYIDNDLQNMSSDRKADRAYAVWIKEGFEINNSLKNMSAVVLEEIGINSITLEECLLLKMKQYCETGRDADTDHIILCAGSRGACNGVPGVNWRDKELFVRFFGPDRAGDRLRAYPAVY